MRNLILLTTALAVIVSSSFFAESSTGGEIKEQKTEAVAESSIGEEVKEQKKDTVHKKKAASWKNLKAVKPEQPDIPAEYKDLEKAFSLYWDLYMKKDYEKLYSMESSAYREANPFNEEKYKKITAVNIKLTAVSALKIEKLNENEKEVLVKGKYYYRIGAIKSLRSFQDKWVREEAGWTHIPSEKPLMDIQTNNKTDKINKDIVNTLQKNEVKITDKKNIEQTKGGVQ